MRRLFRGLAAAIASAALLTAAAPAWAGDNTSFEFGTGNRAKDTPVVFDAMFLRPAGLAMTAVGTAIFTVAAPLVLVTRPTDLGKPFGLLVVKPARYTFVDPLGQHP